jgi:hypothetical protein
MLNDLAKEMDAQAIIHTGDFGFYGQLLKPGVSIL